MSRRSAIPLAYRLEVASRVLAAVVAGYLFTSLATWLLALIWPIPKAQAVVAATLFSFTLYSAVVIRVFCVRTAKRAWIELVLASAVVGLLCLLLSKVLLKNAVLSGGAA